MNNRTFKIFFFLHIIYKKFKFINIIITRSYFGFGRSRKKSNYNNTLISGTPESILYY